MISYSNQEHTNFTYKNEGFSFLAVNITIENLPQVLGKRSSKDLVVWPDSSEYQ